MARHLFIFHRALFVAFIIACTAFSGSSFLQAQNIDTLLQQYDRAAPKEKIHLHFDKPAYLPGETVWFKAYLLSGLTPSQLSKNFYVDWYASDGQLLKHMMLPLFNSVTNGQFTIPQELRGTHVHLRAYTNWMRNFDSAFLYEKSIPLALSNPKSNAAPVKPQVSIRFFPEGGDLITGVSSVLAFEALTKSGYPASLKGAIMNGNGKFIDSIFTTHDGMGKTLFTPAAGETYILNWRDEWGEEGSNALPIAKPNGIVLEAVQQDGNIKYMVKRTAAISENLKTLHVVAHMNQQFLYGAKVVFADASLIKKGIIATASLPAGMIQITVFDASWVPVAERVLFVNNEDYAFTPTITSREQSTNKRGKNVLEIEIPDSISSYLSIAVTDAAVEPVEKQEDNIISRLLLTSELRGRVFHPAYYFQNATDDTVMANLDLLMLTHGWRRLNWEEVFNRKPLTLQYPSDKDYINITGKLDIRTLNKLKPTSIDLWLEQTLIQTQTITLPVLADGSFSQPNIVFFDSVKVRYLLPGQIQLNSASELQLNNSLLNAAPRNRLKSIDPILNDGLFAKKDGDHSLPSYWTGAQGMLLPGVTVTGIKKTHLDSLDDKYTGFLFKNDNSFRLDPEKDIKTGRMNLLTFIQMHTPGIRQGSYIDPSEPNSPPKEGLFWRVPPPGVAGMVSMGALTGLVQIFIDEMPTTYENIKLMGLIEVAYVKVFRPPFEGGRLNAPGGAIAIYTTKSSYEPDNSRGLPAGLLTGYSTIREFYSPNYADSTLANTQDTRFTTLYWSPTLQTDADSNKITVSFYNNDTSKKLRVVLEGMNAEGKLTRIEKLIQ